MDYKSTKVNLKLKKKLKVSLNAYCVLDVIKCSSFQPSYSKISSFLGLSKVTIISIIKKLRISGLIIISKMSDKETHSYLKNGVHFDGCEFCGEQNRIHKYHYPLRKKDGGKKTIPLCESCHVKFHQLADFGLMTVSDSFK